MVEAQPESDHRRSRRRVAVVIVALVVWVLALRADQRDRIVHLTLDCTADGCSAELTHAGAREPVEPVRIEGRGPGRSVGLYLFTPWERGATQYFRELTLRSAGASGFSRELMYERQLPPELVERGWTVVDGVGATLDARPGERSVELLDGHTGDSFTLDVDLISPADAGVIFDAAGPGDGRVFVVRPRFNDAYFFDLHEGRPAGVLTLMPFDRLGTGRELLRLSGLVAEIVLAAAILIALLRALAGRTGGRSLSPVRSERGRPPGWVVPLLLVVTLAALASISWFGLGAVPHLPDETAHLFQAKIFAARELWAPAPPAPEFFEHEHVVLAADRWFGKYPPLFPFLLALGWLIGAEWLVNPLLGALTAYVLYRVTDELAGWCWAVVAWLLALSSPFFLIMGGTMMSHTACALFVTSFLWATLVALRRGRLAGAVLAGPCLGLALFTRPFTAFLAACAVAACGSVYWIHATDRRAVVRALVVIGLSTAPFALGFLAWNGVYDDGGGWSVGLYDAYDDADRLGFGADRGAGWLPTWGSWGHTPAKALRSVHQYLEYTSRHLLGWPWRLSFALAIAAYVGARRSSARWLLGAVFAALIVGHCFYWATQHIVYGARYWYAATPALMVLSALGLRSLGRPRSPGPFRMSGVAAVLLVCVVANLTLYLPTRLRELPEYGGVSAALEREVDERRLDEALVFVETEGLMFNDGFYMNDPFLTRGPIFARDLGPRNRELLAHYPGLRAYRWGGGRLEPIEPVHPSPDVAVVPVSVER